MDAQYKERFFDSDDGLRLFLRRWFLPHAKGLITIVHGFNEHSGRYRRLAEDLCTHGWSVATFDCRGHGQSGGRRAHVDRFQEYLDDLRIFLQEIEREGFSGRPILLGHSLGGLIGSLLAGRDGERLGGLVLSSPFLGMAIRVPMVKAMAGRALSSIMPTLAMKTGLDPGVLSHDQEVVARYAADPLVSTIATARWYTEVLQAQEQILREAAGLTLPLLVMQAGDDRIASQITTRCYYDAAGPEDKTYNLYEGFYHEIFNEVGRDKPVSDLGEWLDRHR